MEASPEIERMGQPERVFPQAVNPMHHELGWRGVVENWRLLTLSASPTGAA